MFFPQVNRVMFFKFLSKHELADIAQQLKHKTRKAVCIWLRINDTREHRFILKEKKKRNRNLISYLFVTLATYVYFLRFVLYFLRE